MDFNADFMGVLFFALLYKYRKYIGPSSVVVGGRVLDQGTSLFANRFYDIDMNGILDGKDTSETFKFQPVACYIW